MLSMSDASDWRKRTNKNGSEQEKTKMFWDKS